MQNLDCIRLLALWRLTRIIAPQISYIPQPAKYYSVVPAYRQHLSEVIDFVNSAQNEQITI